MSETFESGSQVPPRAPTAGSGQLRSEATAVVLAVPGVIRIEPGLGSAVAALVRRDESAGQVSLRLVGGRAVVEVDIVVDRSRSAREVAADVRDQVRTLLGDAGFADAQLRVGVLGIDG